MIKNKKIVVTMFLWLLMSTITSASDILFTGCVIVDEKSCIAKNIEKEVVFIIKDDPKNGIILIAGENSLKSTDFIKYDGAFYILKDEVNFSVGEKILFKNSVYVNYGGTNLESDINQFNDIYMSLLKGRKSKENFETTFESPGFFYSWLIGYKKFKAEFLNSDNSKFHIESITYKNMKDCEKCDHIVFVLNGGRWLVSGRRDMKKIVVKDIANLDG